MKMGLAHISPLWFAACRFGSAALISFLVLGALRRLRLPSRQEWPLVIGVGLLQMGAFTALALWALQYVPPGRASVIAYATAIWVIRFPRWCSASGPRACNGWRPHSVTPASP